MNLSKDYFNLYKLDLQQISLEHTKALLFTTLCPKIWIMLTICLAGV